MPVHDDRKHFGIPACGPTLVQLPISDFGFEMQESSDFKFSIGIGVRLPLDFRREQADAYTGWR